MSFWKRHDEAIARRYDDRVERSRAARRVVVLVALASPLVAFACGSFDSSPAEPGASDGSTDTVSFPEDAADTSTDTKAADADEDRSAPGTVFSDDFELTGAGGCGPNWQPFSATLTVVPGAGIDGGAACRLCRQAANSYSMRKSGGAVTGKAGETYYVEVYVRDEVANDGGNLPGAGLRLSYTRPDGGGHQIVLLPQVTTSWSVVQGNIKLENDASLQVAIEGQSQSMGDCFIADRVRVARQP